MKKHIILALSLATTLGACSNIPPQAYFNRGEPESLLNVSNEQVTVDISQRNGLQQLTQSVNKHTPSSAELSCSNRMLCERASEVLDQFNIPYRQVGSVGNSVTLTYKTIVARDCNNRYIDNPINPYNLNHPTFGCSIAVNQVQMVSDKRQFVDPALLGSYDGFKGAQNYDSYLSRQNIPLQTISASTGGQ